MSAAFFFVVAALGLLAAALWELAGRAALGSQGGVIERLLERFEALRRPLVTLERQILLAGLAGVLSPTRALAAKAAGGLGGAALASVVVSILPSRLQIPLAVLMIAAGSFAVDLVLARAASDRRRRAVAALPDALDLLAVGVSAGQSTPKLIARIAATGNGPLAREMSIVAADIEAGLAQSTALAAMAERIEAPQLAALAGAIERSTRFGAPLADRLREQAGSIRAEQRRALAERADRAAPKIQLVVALVLVPSVLLVLAAALIAHGKSLLPL